MLPEGYDKTAATEHPLMDARSARCRGVKQRLLVRKGVRTDDPGGDGTPWCRPTPGGQDP
ncbi:hypothetical protein Axi01nite_75910 [Actinoplanes xinjiangensis]|nr:hypothetical protein Axi01nite_75910 [Actinoplanes xinjiangensis]